ncbi:MAG: hypothetical protein HWN67_15155 [Candidatus Helarchaeota archaeon]|nr:hypothetical protein [Candidatus Helarchaeota archaeon]
MKDEENYKEFREAEKKLGIGPLSKDIYTDLKKIKEDIRKELNQEIITWDDFFPIVLKIITRMLDKYPKETIDTLKKIIKNHENNKENE